MATQRKAGNGTNSYRQIILRLVQALCTIPDEHWAAWRDELVERGIDQLDPDEMLVFMVLINLPVGAELAERKRQEARPQLHAIRPRPAPSRRSPARQETRETPTVS